MPLGPTTVGSVSLIATWRSEDPHAPIWQASIFTAGILVIAAVALWFTVQRAPEDIAASHNRGTMGTFTVTSSECARGCTTEGTFRSGEARTVRGVRYRSSDQVDVGTTIRAQYFAADRSAYPIDANPWHSYSVLATAMLAYLPFLAACWLTRRGRGLLSWNFNMGRRDEGRRRASSR